MKRILLLVLGLVMAFGLIIGCPAPEETPPPGEEGGGGPPGNPAGYYDHVEDTIDPSDLTDYSTNYPGDGSAAIAELPDATALTIMLMGRMATDVTIGRAMLSNPDLADFWTGFFSGAEPGIIMAPAVAGGGDFYDDYFISISDLAIEAGDYIDEFSPIAIWTDLAGTLMLDAEADIQTSFEWLGDPYAGPPLAVDSTYSSFLTAEMSTPLVMTYDPGGDPAGDGIVTVEDGVLYYLIQCDWKSRMDYEGDLLVGFTDFNDDPVEPSWMSCGVDIYIGFSLSADDSDTADSDGNVFPGKYIMRYELYTAFPDLSAFNDYIVGGEFTPDDLAGLFEVATLTLEVYDNDDVLQFSAVYNGIDDIMAAFGPIGPS